MESEDSARNLDNTGLVILYGRELESTLRKLGASGTGAGELANSIKDRIPQSLFRDICYMMSVRNRFAHAGIDDDEEKQENFDPEDYKEFAEGVVRRLKRLANTEHADSQTTESKNTEKRTGTGKSTSADLSPEEIEFIKFKAEMRRRIQLLGCIPLFNWFYFLFLILAAFRKAAVPISILLLSLASLPPFINGFAYRDNIHIICGTALAAAGYIWTITVFKHLSGSPRWFWWVPVIHVIRVTGMLFTLTDWKKFITGGIGLALDFAAILVLFIQEHPWKFFVIYTVTAFCLSLGHLIFFVPAERGKDEK